ncbi:hypothetical protein D4764_0190120 [Takifugu flavidus]|uniref:Uncharacterized protein n=1 Tax=Takifugu flavidus TaxID=433684 RepID=A0A5C6ML18_9TELE|nr:hypothetical protein D4764_0190120 [Takifugu flavidus]
MQSRGEDAALLEDTGWTLDLAFLMDITGKRNSLNWELQGKAPSPERGGGGRERANRRESRERDGAKAAVGPVREVIYSMRGSRWGHATH